MASVTGLSDRRLAEVRGRLEAFAVEMFDGAARRLEQRRWAGVYLRGLMLDGKRKSIEPMAARLPDGDEQGLQQFVNQSPWDERVVRANLARRMVDELEPEMWVIDDTGFVKKGRFSVGVGRQYSGTLGRVDNCQVGVSINAATDHASCPLNWRIFLPEAWDDDHERRAKAHVPDDVGHREKWRLAPGKLDEPGDLGPCPPPGGASPRRWWAPTPATARPPSFARASTTAGCPTSCRSSTRPRPLPSTSRASGPTTAAWAARRGRATAAHRHH